MLKIWWRKCSQIVLKIYESFLPQRFPPEYSYGTWSYHLMWHVDEIVHVKQLHKGESYSCSLALKIRPLGFSTGLASPACVQDKQHGARTCIHVYNVHVYTAYVDLFVVSMLYPGTCQLLQCHSMQHWKAAWDGHEYEAICIMHVSTLTCTKCNAMPLTF